jgi:drug/metabolite transporter (DMT)-like permease
VTPRTAGLFLLFLTTLGWGFNWPLMKLLLVEMPPLAARSYAAFLGAALLAAIALARGESLAVPRPLWGRLALFSALNVTGWMGFTTIALLWLSAAEGAILAYTMPVWAALLAWLLLGERLAAARLTALALGLGGIALLFAGAPLVLGADQLLGAAMVLAAALLFALGAVLAKRLPLPIPALAAVTWQLVLGCAPLLLISLAVEEVRFAALTATGWVGFVWMAFFALAMAYLCWFGALRRLPAGTATLGTLLVPVIGTFGAALLVGEPLGWRQLAALGCIVAGVALAVRAR